MRYNSPERLEEWKATGAFPAIHNDIFSYAASYLTTTRVLDLCCSYGLLGQRMVTFGLVDFACGVDAEMDTIEAAKAAGITIPLYGLKITPETLDQFISIIREHKVNGIIARRCISELFPLQPAWAIQFADAVREAGVLEFILEGRAIVPKPTHPIPTIAEEVACLVSAYREANRTGQCSYMVMV